MKIDPSTIGSESIMVHPHYVGAHPVVLVQPVHVGAQWTKDTLIFRSSVWDMEGNPVSLSFPKFFNWDERPDLTPIPATLENAVLVEKMDGSTLIFSRYKGHTVVRTRGTVDAHQHANGHEIDELLTKYSKFKELLETQDTTSVSYIFEWTSPTQKIVIDYGPEADMVLVAVIFHNDYSLMKQDGLDVFATQHHLRRPRVFNYNSIEEMKESVAAFKGMEGLCVYYNDGQYIRKVKGNDYLYKHRAKSDIASLEKVIDLYFNQFNDVGPLPSYEEFFSYLSEIFDYEIAEMARGHISDITTAAKDLVIIEKNMQEKVRSLSGLSRKSQAEIVLQTYGQLNRASFVFQLLDGKKWSPETYKKLLYQILER